MTARTHDLFALTAGVLAVAYGNVPAVSLGTALVAGGALFLGGMAPDLDEPGAQVWRRLPAGSGSIVGRVVAPVFGSHRFVTHSVAGLAILGWLVFKILEWSEGFLVVDGVVVWWAFIMGAVSHLVADMLTKEGVPLLWPLPVKFGFPPLKVFRITTGSWTEKVVFVALAAANLWLIKNRYEVFARFFGNWG